MATRRAASGDSDELVSTTQAIYLLGASAAAVLLMSGLAFYQLQGGAAEPSAHASLTTPIKEQKQARKKKSFSKEMLGSLETPKKTKNRGSSGGAKVTSSGGGIDAGKPVSKKNASKPRVVQTFRGSGTEKLQQFSVDGDWSIRWKSDSRFFAAYLHEAKTGELVKTISANNDTNRADFESLPGDYYLTVNTVGNWKIQVVGNRG